MAPFLLEKIIGARPPPGHAQALDGASPGAVTLRGWEARSQPVLPAECFNPAPGVAGWEKGDPWAPAVGSATQEPTCPTSPQKV